MGGFLNPVDRILGRMYPSRKAIAVWQGIVPARQRTDAGIAGRQLSAAEDSSHPMDATGGGTWKVSDTL